MRWSLPLARFSARVSPVAPLVLRHRLLRSEPLEDRRLLALVPELVADINPTGTFGEISQIVALGDVALFVADDGAHGSELWRSDGTDEGTFLLADLNPAGGSLPLFMAPLGDTWLFSADDGEHGRELWRTDGTAEGTMMFWESAPGPDSLLDDAFAGQSAVTEAMTYFTAGDGSVEAQLWKTDGTTDGTQIVSTFSHVGTSGRHISRGLAELTTVGEQLYFTYDDDLHFSEIWATDGTADGTRRVTDFQDNIPNRITQPPDKLVSAGGLLYFTASDAEFGRELWRTDGTDEGTLRVTDIHAYANSYDGPVDGDPAFTVMQPSENGLYFGTLDADEAGETGVWFTYGTVATTRMIRSFSPRDFGHGGRPAENWAVDSNGTLLFASLFDTQFNGGGFSTDMILWSGGPSGARVHAKLGRATMLNSSPAVQQLLHDERSDVFYFTMPQSESGRELWRTTFFGDTEMVKDIVAGPDSSDPTLLTLVGDKLFFEADDANGVRGLWVSDGSEVGTRAIQLPRISSEGSNPKPKLVVGDKLFVSADDGAHGREYWTLDAAGNTSLLKDVTPGAEDDLFQFDAAPVAAYQGQFYFQTYDALWKSDGTEQGTVATSATPNQWREFQASLIVDNDTLYYQTSQSLQAFKGDAAAITVANPIQLRPSIGGQTTRLAMDFIGDNLLFLEYVYDGVWKKTLYTSDSTLGGKKSIATLNLLPDLPIDFAAAGDDAFYLEQFETPVDSGIITTRLYGINLVTGQLQLLKELQDVEPERPQYELIKLNDKLLFTSRSSSIGGKHNLQLWTSDGTPNDQPPRQPPRGTVMVKDFQNGTVPGGPIVRHIMDGLLYLAVETVRNGQPAMQWWRTDGTEQGTVLLHEFNVNSFEDYPAQFTEAGGKLYFTMYDEEHGEELWRTDGTPEGTVMVADIVPGTRSAKILNLTAVNGTLFFSADDQIHGSELWRSDGAEAGTFMVADQATREFPYNSSYPQDFVAFQGSLYFGARDDLHGDELFRLTPPPGDTNFDGLVNIVDLNNVRNNFGGTGLGDANGDGVVNIADLNTVRNHHAADPEQPSVNRPRRERVNSDRAARDAVFAMLTGEESRAEKRRGKQR